MSQRNNFAGGFFLGTLIGGTIGGVLGVLLSNRQTQLGTNKSAIPTLDEDNSPLLDTEANIELARRRLEDKISQLNGAIDDVRHQLSTVNDTAVEAKEEIHS
ncbi:MAG: hypothetical protein ACRC6M_04440 [Microcystaceae cyanobacterium]